MFLPPFLYPYSGFCLLPHGFFGIIVSAVLAKYTANFWRLTMVSDALTGVNGELTRFGEMIPQTENKELKQCLKQMRNEWKCIKYIVCYVKITRRKK